MWKNVATIFDKFIENKLLQPSKIAITQKIYPEKSRPFLKFIKEAFCKVLGQKSS